MLHKALLAAVHHGIVLLVLQQHPYHGGFGYDGVDTLRQPDMPGQRQNILVKAGAVIGPDGGDPPLHRRGTEHPRPHCQIAALGMAAQPQLDPGVLMGHGLRVCHCHFLSRDLPHTTQIEILFPPCQRIVGAPEGEVDGAIPALCRQRRELLRLHRVQMVHKAVELHVPEPGRGCRPAQQLRDLIGHQNAHVDGPTFRFGKIRLRRLPQGHGPPLAGAGDDAAEVHEGQLRQDQVIHFVKRILRQHQIPPPVQIIQNIRHSRPSVSF